MFEITEFSDSTVSDSKVFEKKTLLLENKVPLNIYESRATDKSKTIVVANSLGFPAAFVEPLAQQAADRFRVVTWDQRCMPGPGIQDFSEITPRTHAEDLVRILDYLDVDDAVILGYCNGCEVSLLASRLVSPNRIKRLILSNAHYSFRKQRAHPNTHGLFTMLADIERHPEKAERYYKMLQVVANSDIPVPNTVSKYPFTQGPDKLHRLAVMIANYTKSDIESWVKEVKAECVSVIAQRDDVSDPEHSERIVELLQNASSIPVTNGDHYSLYLDSNFRELVLQEAMKSYADG